MQEVLSWAEALRRAEEGQIRDVCEDSRAVQPGDVFVAVRGRRFDGHDAASDAVRRGARWIVAERPLTVPVPVVVVEDSRKALAELSAARYGHPSRELILVGITGTNGKTTAASLLTRILETAGVRAAMIGTLGARAEEPYHYTTPPAPVLQRTLREQVDAGVRAVVMEVSSHALDQHRVWGCHFTAASLTNISRDHLDYHGTLDAYVEAKRKLFTLLEEHGARAHPAAALPLGHVGELYARDLRRSRVIRYGLSSQAHVRAAHIATVSWSTRFTLLTPLGNVPVSLPLVGRYNVLNALTAAALAVALEVAPSDVARGLSLRQPIPGRMQRLVTADDVTVLIDYAHNPAGLKALLKTVRHAVPGRVISVFGGRGNRDRGKLPLMGKVAGTLADHVILTTDSPEDNDPLELARLIQEGMEELPYRTSWEIVLDRQEAIAKALDLSLPGDAVVITGRGDEPTVKVGARVVEGRDLDWVEEALRRRGRRLVGAAW